MEVGTKELLDVDTLQMLSNVQENLNNSVVVNKITIGLLKEEFGPFFRGELEGVDVDYALANWLRISNGPHGTVDIMSDENEKILTVPPIMNSFHTLRGSKRLPMDSLLNEQKLEEDRFGPRGIIVAEEITTRLDDTLVAQPIDFHPVRELVQIEDIENNDTYSIDDDDDLIYD